MATYLQALLIIFIHLFVINSLTTVFKFIQKVVNVFA